MKRYQWQNRIGTATLAFSLLFGAAIILSTTAQAQYPNDRDTQGRRDQNWDRYGNYGGSVELRQTALNAGYNEGVSAANSERQSGRHSDYRDFDAYRRATNGYNSRLGDRELYHRYFREAFESGFNGDSNGRSNLSRDDLYGNRDRNNDGARNRSGRNWDGYVNYGGSYQLRQTALNAGYNDGMKQGRSDRNRRNRSNYRDNSSYRKATKDYSSRLGDRDLYQRYYRDAYPNGYDDGIGGN
jgi:hypothetical protein